MSCSSSLSTFSLSSSTSILPKSKSSSKSSSSFSSRSKSKFNFRCAVGESVAAPKVAGIAEPLLLSTVRGEKVERPPVWLMRQAGRYMKAGLTAAAV